MYSHLNGHEWLLVHKPELLKEIEQVIEHLDAVEVKTKISKEKTMMGKRLFSPKEINKVMENAFMALGWKEKRVSYWVTHDHELIRKTMHMKAKDQKRIYEENGVYPIRSRNQVDFQKEKVAVEVQFGKYSFIAFDLFVKHLAFYVGGDIEVGVEILPMKCMQAEMSSGPGYYEGALYDLVRQGRGVPAVPLLLIGIEP